LKSTENFTEIVSGEPLRRDEEGVKVKHETEAEDSKYSDFVTIRLYLENGA